MPTTSPYESFLSANLQHSEHPYGLESRISEKDGKHGMVMVNEPEESDQGVHEHPALLAGIIESAMDAIIAVDDSERIVLFNAAAQKMFGCPADEAIGNFLERFIPPPARTEHGKHIRRFAESEVSNRAMGALGTLWGLRATGERFPIEASISKVESDGKKFFTAVIRDITVRHSAEEAVRESEQRFRLVADTAPVLMWMSGTDKLCTYFNKPWLDFTGRSLEEELGNGWAEGVHPDDFERCLRTYTQSFDRREKFAMEYRLRRHDGEYRWVLDMGVPRFNEDGSFAGYIGSGVDVTERKAAERDLGLASDRLRLAMESAAAGGWEQDFRSGRVVWFGKARALLGLTGDEDSVSPQQFWDRVHPEDRTPLRDAMRNAEKNHTAFSEEFRVVWPDGSIHWLSSRGKYCYAANGNPERMLGMSIDITERKGAEETLRQSGEKFLKAFRGSPVAITLSRVKDGRFIEVNDTFERLTGYRREEVIGSTASDIGLWADPSQGAELKKRMLCEQSLRDLELRFLVKNGSVLTCLVSAELIEVGKEPCILSVASDITQRKLAEEALRKSEERFRLAAQVGKMYAYTWDVATDVIVRTPDIAGVLDSAGEAPLTRQQLLAKIHPDDRPLFNASVSEPTVERPDVKTSYRLLCPDGSVVWVEKTAHALFDEGGTMVRMIGMVADITERKRAEDAIREREMQYRRIVETTNEGVWLLDSNLHNSYVNHQMAEMLGYEPGDMVGRSVLDFYFPEDIDRKRQVLTRRQLGLREQIEERLRRKDGSEVWVRLAATPVFKDNGEFDGALAMVSDITERKRAEETLRESEERLRLAVQAGRMYAYEWDVATDVLVRSPEYVKILGSAEPIRFTRQQFLDKIHPDDRPRFLAAIDGLRPEVPTGDVTYRVRLPGSTIVWLKNRARAFFDGDGRMLRVIGMVADVTDHKLAEEALSEMSRKLLEAQEQERARIARDLHDDIGQRLALLGIELSQVQQNRPDLPNEVLSRVEELRKATAEISRDVQALSHELHSSKLEYLGLVGAMQSWCHEFGERQGIGIDFKDHDVPSLPPEVSLCLFRVLQEALHNAAKHSGVKRMEVKLNQAPGEIHFTIRDLGKGFEMEAARRGRGLGLTSMQERVRLVNGTILIQSKPMGGTTIHVRVPLKPEQDVQRAG